MVEETRRREWLVQDMRRPPGEEEEEEEERWREEDLGEPVVVGGGGYRGAGGGDREPGLLDSKPSCDWKPSCASLAIFSLGFSLAGSFFMPSKISTVVRSLISTSKFSRKPAFMSAEDLRTQERRPRRSGEAEASLETRKGAPEKADMGLWRDCEEGLRRDREEGLRRDSRRVDDAEQ